MRNPKKAREEFLNAITLRVETIGDCVIADSMFLYDLDDQQERIGAKGMESLILALLSGSASPFTPAEPHTFRGDLEKLAQERGWDIVESFHHDLYITARLRDWPCPACNGRGHQPIGALVCGRASEDLGSMTLQYCERCRGARTIKSRIKPSS